MASTITVHAPVKGFTGTVAGHTFNEGTADVDRDASALAYFRRHGYGIGEPATPPEVPDPDTVDPVVSLGTLRDGSVDPHPNDFLPPTNAGKANPHGPKVVAPEIHGSQGVRPVTPGDVPVTDPSRQESKEQAATVAATGRTPTEYLTGADGDLFDPDDHTVKQVNEHLADADDAEVARVLELEAAGQDRSTVKAPA